MNNLKKIGLTALAGSLVASSAYAGALSVSGSAGVKYQSKSGSTGSASVQGNPYSDSNGITFSGSGDLDNGMTVGVSYELDGGNYDDYKLTLGLGDGMGTVTFSGNSVNAGGVDMVKDIVPTAYTAVYESTNAVDNGIAAGIGGRDTTSMWGYKNSVGDLTVSVGYNQVIDAAAAGSANAASLILNFSGTSNMFFSGTETNSANPPSLLIGVLIPIIVLSGHKCSLSFLQ